jgi:hypothetical protein
MNKIDLNINEFDAIKVEDCLNYIPYASLEQSINRYVKQALNILCKNEIIECDNNKKIEFILKQVLLRIATSNAWVNNQEKHKLNKHYLYTVIKKYIYQYFPELIQD